MKTQASNAIRGRQPFAGAVQVQMIFWLPTPKVHRGETWAAVRGRDDLSKLIRAVEDAMTDGGFWLDDALESRIEAEKRYCGKVERPGVDVTVEAL